MAREKENDMPVTDREVYSARRGHRKAAQAEREMLREADRLGGGSPPRHRESPDCECSDCLSAADVEEADRG